MSRNTILILALAAGALLRAVYFFSSRSLPFFDFPITDAWYHHRLATAIASGMIWDGQPFFRAPLYPYLLGGLYSVFGAHVVVGKLLGHLAGLVTGGLVIAWADRLWGRSGALWAAGLWLFSGLLLFYEGELLVDTVFTCLCLASLYTLSRARGTSGLAGSGALLGLAAITRPTVLVCVPLALWWAFRNRRLLSDPLVWLAACILPVGVVAAVNTAALGRPTGLATSGGVNFYLGNHEGADGCSAVMPEPWGYAWSYHDLSLHASRMEGRALDAGEVSDYYYRLGLKFIREQPADAAGLFLRKAVLSASRLSISNNLNLSWVQDHLPMLRLLAVRMSWLLVLAAAGLIWLARSPADARLLWIFLASYAAVLVLFFTNERFRLPLVPALLILGSGVPVLWLRSSARERSLAFVAAGICALVAFPNWYGIRETPARAYFNLGNVALRRGNNQEARAWFDSAVTVDPGLHQVYLNRGLARLRLGDLDGAASDFRQEAALDPADARPFNNLAAVHLLAGDTSRALDAIDSGLARDSSLGLLYLQRLRVAGAFGDTLALALDLKDARRHAGLWPVWTYWEAELWRRRGQSREARRLYEELGAAPAVWPSLDALEQFYAAPDSTVLTYHAGLTFLDERQFDSAEVCFQAAARADSGFAEAWSNWGTSAVARGDFPLAVSRYRVALQSQPRSPVYLTNLAWAHLAMDRKDSALACLELALRYDSLFIPAHALHRQILGQP